MRTIDLLAELIGDAEFPGLESFALDHLSELRRLEGFTIDDLQVTQLSARRVEAEALGFTLVLTGGQLAAVGSADELARAIDSAFSDGTFSLMELSFDGMPILSFSLTEDGYVFRSGQQALHFTANWPETLSELFENLHALVLAQSDEPATRTGRAVLEDIRANENWQGLALFDGQTELAKVTLAAHELSVTAEGLSLSVRHERVLDNMHIALHIAGQDTSTETLSKISSANLDELKGRVPELADALEVVLTPEETERIDALVDHTYIAYRLDQATTGPFDFHLTARIDHFYRETLPMARRGTEANDTLIGTTADELFLGLAGDDTISGGAGEDAARFFGRSNAFSVEIGQDGIEVRDRHPDGEGADWLTEVEQIHFDDLTVDVSALDLAGAQAGQQIRELANLYIAYFDRAPDAQGLLFWLRAHQDGMSMEDISAHFWAQPETAFLRDLAYQPNALVEEVYDHVLNRAPDAAGQASWSAEIGSGRLAPDVFILQFLEGAGAGLKPALGPDFVAQQLADQAYLESKIDIGVYFAVHKGMSDVENASAAMALFDGSQGSIAEAVAAIDGFFADALDPTGGEFLMPLVGVLDDPFLIG